MKYAYITQNIEGVDGPEVYIDDAHTVEETIEYLRNEKRNYTVWAKIVEPINNENPDGFYNYGDIERISDGSYTQIDNVDFGKKFDNESIEEFASIVTSKL